MVLSVSLLDMVNSKECFLYIPRNYKLPPFKDIVEKQLLSVSIIHQLIFCLCNKLKHNVETMFINHLFLMLS